MRHDSALTFLFGDRFKQILERPQPIHEARLHSWGWQPLAAGALLAHSPDKIVVGDVHGDGGCQILQLLRETDRQPGEAAQERTDRQVVPFDV